MDGIASMSSLGVCEADVDNVVDVSIIKDDGRESDDSVMETLPMMERC